LTIFVIVGIMTEAHSFRIGSESHCILGLSNKILETSDSEVGLKQRNQEELPVVKVSVEK